MKRVLVSCLLAGMLIVGCGGGEKKADKPKKEKKEAPAASAPAAAPAAAPAGEAPK